MEQRHPVFNFKDDSNTWVLQKHLQNLEDDQAKYSIIFDFEHAGMAPVQKLLIRIWQRGVYNCWEPSFCLR